MIFRKLLIRLKNYLTLKTKPHEDELVSSMIRNTASLELSKTEYVEFAPMPGVCGVMRLSGNCLPVFQYLVFDKKAPMEFVKVRVEVSMPDRIIFISHIQSSDPKFDGKKVETKEEFKTPFTKLSLQLYEYFPFTRAKQFVNPCKVQEEVKNVAQS